MSRERLINPWATFIVVALAQFMVVLDASIMNVAIPTIRTSLKVSQADLQWIITIYVLMFGGFLLLGGRAGDLFGRRRLFIGGLILFSIASLAGGLAQSLGWLVVARGVQGLGGAVISPVALAIISTTFAEGADRNKALGFYGAIAGVGGAAGVLLGGVLTSSFGWQWCLFVNVPVGIAAAALSLRFIHNDEPVTERRNVDIVGAVTVTAALVSLVYGIVKAPQNGWGSSQTIGFVAVAVVLFAGFIVWEMRQSDPLVRLSIFTNRSLTVSNISAMLTGAAMFAMFYFLSLYLQIVLNFSALKTGIAYLPLALMIMVSAAVAAQLVNQFGFKPILATGMLMAAAGFALLVRMPVSGHYWPDVLPPMLLLAAGLGLTFVPVQIAAVTGVGPEEIGLASGLINTSLQVGGAVGLAILSTISTSRFNDSIKTLRGPSAFFTALVDGYHGAFLAGGIFIAAGAVIVLVLLPHHKNTAAAEEETEPLAALA